MDVLTHRDGTKRQREDRRILVSDLATLILAAFWLSRRISTVVLLQLVDDLLGREARRPRGTALSESCSPSSTFVNGRMVTPCSTAAAPSRHCFDGDGLKLFQQYVEKIHPMTIPRPHGPDVELTSKEIAALRGLCGALQWPSVQSSLHLQASVSLAAGQVNHAKVSRVQDLNQTLKFAKQNGDS